MAAAFIAASTLAAISSGLAAGPGQSTARLPGASGQTCGAPGFKRLAQVGDGIERLVFDLDGLRAILGRRVGLADHHGDGLADVATRSPARRAAPA